MSSNDSNHLPELRLTEQEFNALGREDQEYYLYLLQEEVNYRKSRKILYYQPLPKVDPFHKSLAPVRALFGGNRSGKTTGGGMEFLFHMTGQYPDWYPAEARYKRAVKGRIVATDFLKGVGEVIIPFLDEWLDPSMIAKRSRNPMGVPIKWFLKNGSVFDILTHEQSTNQFEGWKGDIVWFDEPPPRDRYIATTRGLVDFNGRHWLTLTPLTQPWIYDEIYTKNGRDGIYCVTMDMRDNTHLTEGAIKQFESALTEEDKEARLHGKFMHLSGLVYKEFDPPVHIVDEVPIKQGWTRYFAIDPHERTPTACLWLAADPHDNLWIYDELWLKDMDIESISHAIHAQEGELLPRVRLIDPHADKDNAIAGGFNIRKELMKYGVYCQRANSDPALGKARIRQALTPRYSAILKTEVPRLHIARSCTQTIYEFQHYIWDDYRRNKEDFDQKEQVKKKNDHFMDALRYIFNSDPHYVAPDEEEPETEYAGTYAKYPVKQEPKGSYHSLVENPNRGGQF